MVIIKVGRKSFNQCGVVRDTVTESSYIVLAGGKTNEKEISTSEVFRIGSHGMLEGPSMPDSQFNYGSTLVSSNDK